MSATNPEESSDQTYFIDTYGYMTPAITDEARIKSIESETGIRIGDTCNVIVAEGNHLTIGTVAGFGYFPSGDGGILGIAAVLSFEVDVRFLIQNGVIGVGWVGAPHQSLGKRIAEVPYPIADGAEKFLRDHQHVSYYEDRDLLYVDEGSVLGMLLHARAGKKLICPRNRADRPRVRTHTRTHG